VFWFADADAAQETNYPPTTFRWINNQKEAEEAVESGRIKAAKRLAEGGSANDSELSSRRGSGGLELDS
jgi:6-phosphogluconolactonase